MVTNVTSLTGNGLKDWLIQRVTALYFAIYILLLGGFMMSHPALAYHEWQALFAGVGFKIATIVAFISFALHAWIGIWTVTTDYIKCVCIRLMTQVFVAFILMSQVIWGSMIVWGQ